MCDNDSDEEVKDIMKDMLDENNNVINVEEFHLNGTRGVAFAAYQNEEITDFFHWNDKESIKKKD